MSKAPEIRYLNPVSVEVSKKKYCRFKKSGIKYIDYKDADFLLKFVNEQGKILPRRLTGTSVKYQRKVGTAIKRARHLGLMPYVADFLK
jgi:small subunit ribosomal protein S18